MRSSPRMSRPGDSAARRSSWAWTAGSVLWAWSGMAGGPNRNSSLRAKRSNPERVYAALDCRVASLLAMTMQESLRRLLGRQIGDQAAERRGQVLAMDDHVDHAVVEQIFGALEAFGELFADRVLDHALARKADQRRGFADLDIAEHGIAGGDAARDRKSVVEGKSGYVRVDLGGRRILKKKNK